MLGTADWFKKKFPEESEHMIRLWRESWRASRLITVAALATLVIVFGGSGIWIGRLFNTTNITNVIPAASSPQQTQQAQPALSTQQPIPKTKSQYVKNIVFYADPKEGRPLYLTAAANITTNRLRVFVDFSWKEFLNADSWMPRIRTHIADLDVVREQQVDVQLAFKDKAGSISDTYWGSPEENFPIGPGANRGRVVFIGPDNQEQRCYFLVAFRDDRDGGRRITVISGPELDWVNQWEAEK